MKREHDRLFDWVLRSRIANWFYALDTCATEVKVKKSECHTIQKIVSVQMVNYLRTKYELPK